MRYLHVQWVHDHPDEPVEVYSEIKEDGWEVRKIELFPEGSVGYAAPAEGMGPTMLSVEPLPPLEEIASDPQFKPVEISREEFERLWERRPHPSIAKPA